MDIIFLLMYIIVILHKAKQPTYTDKNIIILPLYLKDGGLTVTVNTTQIETTRLYLHSTSVIYLTQNNAGGVRGNSPTF